MGDQADNPLRHVTQLSQVPGTVQWVKAGLGQLWGIADVVQPSSSH
jgi:hypothetical protein